MTNFNGKVKQTKGRIRPVACIATLLAGVTGLLAEPVHARRIDPPAVPADIEVPAGSKAFFEGRGIGTQNYICLPAGSAAAWTLFTPQATLFKNGNKQVTTHYFSPNKFENGTVRATWQHSRDTSTVWGEVVKPSSDPNFVAPGAIPWLLIHVVGAQDGPGGGDTLTRATHIQRVNTFGGSAPSTGCTQPADVGKKVFVPYMADYFFYTNRKGEEADDD